MKVFTLLLAMAAACAAEDSLPGAKKLFYEPISDAVIKDPKPAVGTKPKGGGSAVVKPAPGNIATGVNYTIELQTPDGKTSLVPATTIFHTGDRIRLHIRSNVDGKLAVMWNQDQGPFHLLFPPDPSTDNRVKKFVDNVYPAKFFRFDQTPGDVTMMLMVTAEGATPNMVAVTAPAHVATGSPSPQAPAEPPSAPARAAAPTANTSDLRAQYDRQVREEYEKLKGSKGLVMEDDTTGPDPSTTVVSVPWRDRNITPGVVVVEVRLKHRP